MIKQKILTDLKRVTLDLGFPTTDIVCSIPKNPGFGDYSTNLALQLAKLKVDKVKQTPVEIANQIISRLSNLSCLNKVENKGGGFINFFVKPEYLAEDLTEILQQGKEFGKANTFKDKKARVEFVSANPTGPLHIGNARGGPIGDVIANVLEAGGYEVLREYIHNDVGEQVKALGATIKAKYHDNLSSDNQYQGEYVGELVEKLGKEIESKPDGEVGKLAVDLMYKDIMADIHAMGIKFDLVVKESELREQAPQIIKELRNAGVIKEKDGALWLAPNDEFLKDRETVIQKSDQGYTYFTSDIVYHKRKFESGADLIIDVFGSNHHGHVPRLQAAVSALGFDTNRLKVILYQYVRVKRGEEVLKMSKRAGNFITAGEVMDEVGVDAFRFYLLKFAPQTHMDFDLELVKQQSANNPVYYVQYAHARMFSILSKAEIQGGQTHLDLLINPKETMLIKHLLSYPDLMTELASNLQVHQLTEYVITLADYFHKFYEVCPVLSAESPRLVNARLVLVKVSKITLANALGLLGVSAPEKM